MADIIAGINHIGKARDALRDAGFRAVIAANRITVDNEIFALFAGIGIDPVAGSYPRWLVYSVTAEPEEYLAVGPDRAAMLGPAS
ncbi:hypothetical protein MJO55_24320 [Mycolicibacterium rufum]|uniref:Uncharacterized protein n=1 Tax=Mycolicibacterium rufum TaxID=318424 RepID=A0A9X3BHI9_9MYCO|nr:hypothetical protein [Mycolicibacterium rufum]KGI70046.1 hypothetical protein EU78_24235 [Mycolicibacterium rufum]MCV7071963.1 hypothetical protein [Mycolicibacterium rufum]ULP36302.2 hypothetical protein MJO55_24320 [Mycolicibacterium rufum]